jgi:3-hydroxy-9,10-secoandrosta-1,3,5(10)-triene-9,17-dione monooxygenase
MAEMMAYVRAGKKIPVPRRVRFRHDSSNAVSKCVDIVDRMFTASGGGALFLNNPLQRFFQDIHACRAHFANNPDKPARNFGSVQLGNKTSDFFI